MALQTAREELNLRRQARVHPQTASVGCRIREKPLDGPGRQARAAPSAEYDAVARPNALPGVGAHARALRQAETGSEATQADGRWGIDQVLGMEVPIEDPASGSARSPRGHVPGAVEEAN
jgi:hypothetical protein